MFLSFSVSHTTDDLVFQWDPEQPLVVDDKIELPQLALVSNKTSDCTQVYSTGNFTCLEVVFVLKRRLGYYLFHTYVPTCLIVIMSVSVGLLKGYFENLPFIQSIKLNVSPVGVLLDQTGSCSSPRDPWRYLPAYTIHATCQVASIAPARVLSKGRGRFHVRLHNV